MIIIIVTLAALQPIALELSTDDRPIFVNTAPSGCAEATFNTRGFGDVFGHIKGQGSTSAGSNVQKRAARGTCSA